MALKDWNIGKKPAQPPASGWSPLKEFIRYEYGKSEASPRLPQAPASGVNSKQAVDALAKRVTPKK